MDRENYTDESYAKPHVPPATAPVIDAQAEPRDAAELAHDSGDSDYPGTREASVERGTEDQALYSGPRDGNVEHGEGDEEIAPGDSPDELVPDEGDLARPTSPDEIEVEEGDTVNPGKVPDETRLPPD